MRRGRRADRNNTATATDTAAGVALAPTARTVGDRERAGAPILTVFAATWAIATFFHTWVNPRSVGVLTSRNQLGISHLVAEILAAAVLMRPSSTRRLVLLCMAHLWAVWMELPFTGNHWVLVGLVDIALLLAAASCWKPGNGVDRPRLAARFVPVARWCLVGFYFFAAFSKVNSSFLKPSVSCGTFFFNETAHSLGLGSLVGSRTGGAAVAAMWATICIELSVPVLLGDRRFRHVGVMLGLCFHFFIALDQTHSFADFSAVLVALFVLFLPPDFPAWLLTRWRRFGAAVAERLNDQSAARALVVVVTGLALLESLLLAMPGTSWRSRVFVDFRQSAWVVYGLAAIVMVAWYLRAERPACMAHPFRLDRWWLALVPLLVVLNGLTPYTELKTGFGWNMYSNLYTVDGASNHLLVRQTFPLTDAQKEPVAILDSNDPALEYYATNDYDLAWLQLREYLSRHPDVSIRYQRGLDVVDLTRASDAPALVAPVPVWEQKLALFRAIDQNPDAVRCQPGFAPAR